MIRYLRLLRDWWRWVTRPLPPIQTGGALSKAHPAHREHWVVSQVAVEMGEYGLPAKERIRCVCGWETIAPFGSGAHFVHRCEVQAEMERAAAS